MWLVPVVARSVPVNHASMLFISSLHFITWQTKFIGFSYLLITSLIYNYTLLKNIAKSWMGRFYECVSSYQLHRALETEQWSIILALMIVLFPLSLFQYLQSYHKDLLLQGQDIYMNILYLNWPSSPSKLTKVTDLHSHFHHYFYISMNALESLIPFY